MKNKIEVVKCTFETKIGGFYITPLIGFSIDKQNKFSFWIGWFTFLFTIRKAEVK
jgi:hypothetical protein